MSSPTPSNILQNDAEVLEKQWKEMQRRHEEEQWLLAQLEEVAKLRRAEKAVCIPHLHHHPGHDPHLWQDPECY